MQDDRRMSSLAITVGWGDCAPSGAVFYPNYFRWFDQAMWGYFDAVGRPLAGLEAEYGIVGLPLIETRANFKGPCRLHDQLIIETRITGFQRKTLEMTHHVLNGDDLAVEATDIRFWGVRHPEDPRRLQAEVIPADVIEYLRGGGD